MDNNKSMEINKEDKEFLMDCGWWDDFEMADSDRSRFFLVRDIKKGRLEFTEEEFPASVYDRLLSLANNVDFSIK
jgi:hypothetical protein